MLLRDLQVYLRRRFGLRGSRAAAAAAAERDRKNAQAQRALHAQRGQDFAPWIPPLEEISGVVFAYGRMKGVTANWVRDRTRWFQLVPPDDYVRNFWTAARSWGIPQAGQRFPRQACWVAYADGVHVAEAFELRQANGQLRGSGENGSVGDFPRVRLHVHNSIGQLVTPAAAAGAQRFGAQMGQWAVSSSPYRVDKNAGANPWLTIGAEVMSWDDWEYDLEGGTPAGWYDLRAGCQNMVTSPEVALSYPPPPKKQSEVQPGSSDVGCFRWVPNPNWVSDEPTSPKYRVHSYAFDIDHTIAPDGSPMEFGSTWDTIDPSGGILQLKKDRFQSLSFEEDAGATWYEGANLAESKMMWALIKTFDGQSAFRYRYPCSFTTVRKGGNTTDPGRIYQTEVRDWGASGLRVLDGDNVIYDDGPVVSLARVDEEDTFPSSGGWFALTSPQPNTTLRGLWDGGLDFYRLRPHPLVRADGDFYVLSEFYTFRTEPATGDFKIARRNALLDTPIDFAAAATMPWALMREVDGRLWIFAHGPILM